MRRILEECPSCGGRLTVTGLACERCGTTVGGRFQPCDFCRLSEEQSTFLRLFVQRRGNLSELEKALGISYPTVRNKLEEIIRLLQQDVAPAEPVVPGTRDALLRAVAAGTLGAEEALAQLQRLTEKGGVE